MSNQHLTLAEIAELEALERGATPGPWRADSNAYEDQDWVVEAQGTYVTTHSLCEGDAAFVAALRNAAPRLLAVVKEQVKTRWTPDLEALRAANRVLIKERNEALARAERAEAAVVKLREALEDLKKEAKDLRVYWVLESVNRVLSAPNPGQPLLDELAAVRKDLAEFKARDERSIHALAAAMSEYGFLDESWSQADWDRFIDIVRIHMEPSDREALDQLRAEQEGGGK